MAKKIRINSYTGPSDGADLDGYYFEESGDGYNFYAPTTPNPTQLNTSLLTPANASCSFPIPAGLVGAGTTFSITVTSFPAVVTMSGTWTDATQSVKDVPGSGTFQAQASGGGTVEEEAHAASAK